MASEEIAPYPIPPEHLRFRVHGAVDAASFLAVGQQCSEDLQAALATVNRTLDSFEAILDFGCGSGRTLRFLMSNRGGGMRSKEQRFYGTDIDREAVVWCRQHLPGSFLCNDAFPPLPCQDASFDLIYAISVFTHLDETIQFSWLRELQRLTKPGGIVILTTHGETHFNALPSYLRETVAQRGFFFLNTDGWRAIFPQWYQDSFHTMPYIRQNFSRYFEVCSILPEGMNNRQDVVILQRRDEPLLPEPALPDWARITQLERHASALHRVIAAKNAHIAKLEGLLDQVARGRLMRLLNYGFRK